MECKVIYSKPHKRYVIVDDKDNIINDANGHGFKSEINARKAMNYLFKGGKEKKDDFIKNNPDVIKKLQDLYEWYWKDIAHGIMTRKDIYDILEEEFGKKFDRRLLSSLKI